MRGLLPGGNLAPCRHRDTFTPLSGLAEDVDIEKPQGERPMLPRPSGSTVHRFGNLETFNKEVL